MRSKKENIPMHAGTKTAMERVELIERILRQIDSGYLDLNAIDDAEEIGIIRMTLCRYKTSIEERWL